MHLWLPAYLRQRSWTPPEGKVVDILLAVCDHFEPFHHTDKAGALKRMQKWNEVYPQAIDPFRDADGCRPRHSFFYPIEQYDEDVLRSLETLCRSSGGEVEIHLHHHDDTEAGLRDALAQGKANFRRHGFLSQDAQGGSVYGFIHGNWVLDNSHPAGDNCGVSNELTVLQDTGCYADFTMPSAPHPAQTRTINQIYYAKDTPQPKSHDVGTPAAVNTSRSARSQAGNNLLLVQGPLGLNWERRKWGIMPRIENADLTGANPPRMDRLRLWLRQGIQVAGRPEWVFVKLHTHGAVERNSDMLLGSLMQDFHRELLAGYNDGKRYRLHYVSAREMVNIIHAAEDGKTGNPGAFRDYVYARPQASQGTV
ncbi:MAG: hypothetical protein K0Q55_1092 [Verrucomicrobia bacterium]|jgi:hypothetical protein|nr:hypothetical protein [Verrucomicrobiota bacterium]